jgi:hypothetical protein
MLSIVSVKIIICYDKSILDLQTIGLMPMPDVCTMGNFVPCSSRQAVLKLSVIWSLATQPIHDFQMEESPGK